MRKIIFNAILGISVGTYICLMPGYAVEISQKEYNVSYTDYLHHPTAWISAQCYTQTKDEKTGSVHNPCYACHTRSVAPNYLNDSDFQLSLDFRPQATTNPFTNTFEDRSALVAQISDEDITNWVNKSNYLVDGRIIIADVLKNNLPQAWDYDKNGQWDGYIPDAWFIFDDKGYDVHPVTQERTGWRAFGYQPFLGTFWPTNGSTDDVLVRLPKVFRQNINGEIDWDIYNLNLWIVEALIRQQDIQIIPTDEQAVYYDLNADGKIEGISDKIIFNHYPLEQKYMQYAGFAATQDLKLAGGLFPVGTEFLHSVRYISTRNEQIGLGNRMKELRYMRKGYWQNWADLRNSVDKESKEANDFPDRLRMFHGDFEHGISNGTGWYLQAWIEDRDGSLRPQNREETIFCMGCHGGMGTTSDSIFSFSRKYDATDFQQGWYHWSQKGLVGKPDLKNIQGEYEYTKYLENNRSVDEFRANDEGYHKFFDSKGNIKQDMVAAMQKDITVLILPSLERAINLNKAWRALAIEQDYINGRDAVVTPAQNVHKEVEAETITGIEEAIKKYNLQAIQ